MPDIWDRWLAKGYGARALRRLVEAIQELVDHRPVRVAHVEDDRTDALLVDVLALQKQHWTVNRFSDYEAAIEELVHGDVARYDCVLMDIMLPSGWEGLHLAARIKERRADIPVIMWTNRAKPDADKVDGLLGGFPAA